MALAAPYIAPPALLAGRRSVVCGARGAGMSVEGAGGGAGASLAAPGRGATVCARRCMGGGRRGGPFHGVRGCGMGQGAVAVMAMWERRRRGGLTGV